MLRAGLGGLPPATTQAPTYCPPSACPTGAGRVSRGNRKSSSGRPLSGLPNSTRRLQPAVLPRSREREPRRFCSGSLEAQGLKPPRISTAATGGIRGGCGPHEQDFDFSSFGVAQARQLIRTPNLDQKRYPTAWPRFCFCTRCHRTELGHTSESPNSLNLSPGTKQDALLTGHRTKRSQRRTQKITLKCPRLSPDTRTRINIVWQTLISRIYCPHSVAQYAPVGESTGPALRSDQSQRIIKGTLSRILIGLMLGGSTEAGKCSHSDSER